jgi:hypothetical protein
MGAVAKSFMRQRKVPEIKRDSIECEGGRETEKGEVEGETNGKYR